MQQLLKSYRVLSIFGPLLALMFLLNFSQKTISIVLFVLALALVFKKSLLPGLFFLVFAILLSQGITTPALYYPVIVSFIIFSVFFASLFSNKCLIHRFAEKMEPELPKHAVAYCYKVNIVWSLFLALNTTLAYLSTKDLKIWAWYNGLISYLLIALLFVCEYLYRQRYRRANESK